MHHHPTQLALLISLIGLGVAPHAHALVGHPTPGGDHVANVGCDGAAAQASSACVPSGLLMRSFPEPVETSAALVDPLRVTPLTAGLEPAAVGRIAMNVVSRRAQKVRTEVVSSQARLRSARAVAPRKNASRVASVAVDGRQAVKEARAERLESPRSTHGDTTLSLLQGFDRFENAYADLPRSAFDESRDESASTQQRAVGAAPQASTSVADAAETPRQQNVRRILRDLRIVLEDDVAGVPTSQQIASDAAPPSAQGGLDAAVDLPLPLAVSQVDVLLPLPPSIADGRGPTSDALLIEQVVTESVGAGADIDVPLSLEVSAVAVVTPADQPAPIMPTIGAGEVWTGAGAGTLPAEASASLDGSRTGMLGEQAGPAPAVVDVLLPIPSAQTVDLLLPLEAPRRTSRAKFRTAMHGADGATPFGDRATVVADAALDTVRGGYATDSLNISFGISRAVYVNGELMTTTSLNVSDLGKITQGRTMTAGEAASLGVIQSGAGNVIAPTIISSTSGGAVVQNTLDGQKIQNLTVINASANSLGLLKGYNLESSLRGAVIDSLRR